MGMALVGPMESYIREVDYNEIIKEFKANKMAYERELDTIKIAREMAKDRIAYGEFLLKKYPRTSQLCPRKK